MINAVMFEGKCDRCGMNHEIDSYWSSKYASTKKRILHEMKKKNWTIEGNRHYCPSCKPEKGKTSKCLRCEKPSIGDYNGNGEWLCEGHMEQAEKEFEDNFR